MDRKSGVYATFVMASFAAVGIATSVASRSSPSAPSSPADASLASFTNWETGHVHPVDLTPDGSTLLVCNTADARLAVFSVATGLPVLVAEIPVGLDPISVRARTNTEVWVVNAISDTVSVVSLTSRNVVATIKCKNEPSDVVFAGTPQRAFVTCSQAKTVQVFDPSNLGAPVAEIPIAGEAPRALAVSPDRQKVYAAVFESGNASTVLPGGQAMAGSTNAVSSASSPYGGVNPPPNSGNSFSPPLAAGLPVPPPVSMIVKRNAAGQWMDDNSRDWSSLVSGPAIGSTGLNASGRVPGWTLPDRDVAIIDASSLGVTYATGLMNICAATAVNPATGQIAVVGLDATNEIRFEPNVNGKFVRVQLALVNPSTLAKTTKDLNPHLTYATSSIPVSERNKSIGDPRGVVFNAAGTKAYVTGMGSNNVIVINAAGDRAGLAPTIDVGAGPTGLALDEARGRLYVLNRFDASISVIQTGTETIAATVPFFDPTPTAIKVGRKHLYDTHKNSGLGQASCASCHIDARTDRLGWDLGDPSGSVKTLAGQNLGGGLPGLAPASTPQAFQPWHPMKGPMTTQTLQDIIGKEPLHWRGDRAGLEEFNGAFVGLLGADQQLTPTEMQQFEDFLATINYPPNPYRNMDNSLPTSLALPGHYASGRYTLPAGAPLPAGNPQNGLTLYTSTTRRVDRNAFACVTCHTLPTGIGPDVTFNLATQTYVPFPVGANGERHAALVSVDGATNVSLKTPQIRNNYLKVGFEARRLDSTAGFGFARDGSVDSISSFVSSTVFTLASDQEIADMVAFILCLSGGDLPSGAANNPLFPPGLPGKDSPAGVGVQTTLVSASSAPASQLTLINSMISLAQSGKLGLIVKGRINGESRGFAYVPASGVFQSDRAGQTSTPASLQALAAPGSELTYTLVTAGNQTRMGIDRDENGVLDADQAAFECYANCDASTVAPVLNAGDFSCFLNRFRSAQLLPPDQQLTAYANCDGSTVAPVLNAGDFSCFLSRFRAGCN